jgi:predicted membrane metal-binding protein
MAFRGQDTSHERLVRDEPDKGSSDRAFGLVFTAVFLIIGALPLLKGAPPRLWSFGVAAVILIVALLAPRVLAPFNRVWTKFGLLLNAVVSPVVMGLLFFLVIMPIGALMRALGKKPLHLQVKRDAKSYWIERQPPGPAPDTMKNQF